MATTTSHVVEVLPSLFQEDAADHARNLIMANELYKASNNAKNDPTQRAAALQEASELTSACLQDSPNMPAALSLMARIRMDQHRLDEAESLVRKALEGAEGSENIHLNYAYVLMAKHQYSLAEAQFMRVLQINAHSYQAFSGIALAKLRQNDFGSAFFHYQRLLELGYNHDLVRFHFLEAARHVVADEYQTEMEQWCLEAFSWRDIDHQPLANLASSLLIHKYHLDSDDAPIDIDVLAKDELLIELFCKTTLQNPVIEKLAILLRRSILEETVLSANMRESLIPLVIALGLSASSCEFAWQCAIEEDNLVDVIEGLISDAFMDAVFDLEDVSGALMVFCMYRSAYESSIKVHLLGYALTDWPSPMQDLIQANLFEPSNEHQGQYDLFGNRLDILLDNSVRRASDRWKKTAIAQVKSLGQALQQIMPSSQIPVRLYDSPTHILIVGCGSGERAIHLARGISDAHVTAIDMSQENIAYAFHKANELGLTNIEFSCHNLDIPLENQARFDLIEFGPALNHVENPLKVIRHWKKLLNGTGFIRMQLHTEVHRDKTEVVHQLVKSRRLSPTAENIRQLRSAIIEETQNGLWDALLRDARFFTASGCRDLFFRQQQHFFDFDKVEALLFNAGLDLAGPEIQSPESAFSARAGAFGLLKTNLGTLDSVEIYCKSIRKS